MQFKIRESIDELKDKIDQIYRTIIGEKTLKVDDPRILMLKDQVDEVTDDLLTETTTYPCMG